MIIEEEKLKKLGISDWSLQQCKYACSSLPCYLKDKPKAELVACAIAIILSEPFARSYIEKRIDKATGYSLDIIGNNNFCKRNLMSDDDYKKEIKKTIANSQTTTTADFITNFFKNYYNCIQCFYAEEKYNIVALYVSFNEDPTNYDFLIMKNILASGIGLKIYYVVGIEEIVFIDGDETRYGIKLCANGEPIIVDGCCLCVSDFKCITAF